MVCGKILHASKAPLCKGSCREATEGLCSTVLQFRKCFGEKAYGNDFAAESSYFNDASAKRGQNGHCTFGRWAHREVHHYNPSVTSLRTGDSSPYTGEPLTRTASSRTPLYHTAVLIKYFLLCQPNFCPLGEQEANHVSFHRRRSGGAELCGDRHL